MIDFSSVGIIQQMLAPGIMISACGLLILGINNKYSIVVGRIRALEEEKRRLVSLLRKNNIEEEQKVRLNSIVMQVDKFGFRVKLIRNAVFFYSIAVAFFILASLSIGLQFMTQATQLETVSLTLFLLGMLSVLLGILQVAREIWKGHEIVKIEIRESEF